jgi:hypothetical protein
MESKQSRLRVVGRAVKLAAVLAILPALSVPQAAPFLWASIMAGPFAGLWADPFWNWPEALWCAAGCGLAIAAYLLRPCWLTALISLAGVGMWLFLGVGLTFSGV